MPCEDVPKAMTYRIIPPDSIDEPAISVNNLTNVERAMEIRLVGATQEIRAARRRLRDGASDVMIRGWLVFPVNNTHTCGECEYFDSSVKITCVYSTSSGESGNKIDQLGGLSSSLLRLVF